MSTSRKCSGVPAPPEAITGTDAAGNAWESNDENIKTKIIVEVKKKEVSFEISSIEFESGKYNLPPQAVPVLRMVLDILEKYPDYTVNVIGHTDDVGSEEANLRLSKNRASAVVNFLKENIIDLNRIHSSGKGESEPVASNKTDEGKAKNRRVEFRLKKNKN